MEVDHLPNSKYKKLIWVLAGDLNKKVEEGFEGKNNFFYIVAKRIKNLKINISLICDPQLCPI